MLKPFMCLALGLFAVASCVTSSAARGGHGRGGYHFAGKGKPQPPIYVALEASDIKDAASFQSLLGKLTTGLVPFGGHLLVDSETPSALAGQSPHHFALIAFDKAIDVTIWKDSAAFSDLTGPNNHTATMRVFSVAGLPDAAIAFQNTDQGPDAVFNSSPEKSAPNNHAVADSIKDICKGC